MQHICMVIMYVKRRGSNPVKSRSRQSNMVIMAIYLQTFPSKVSVSMLIMVLLQNCVLDLRCNKNEYNFMWEACMGDNMCACYYVLH